MHHLTQFDTKVDYQYKTRLKSKSAQKGMSFIGMLFFGGILACIGIVIAQIIPTAIEYQAIMKACNSAKTGSNVAEIRSTFEKNKATGYFDAISGKDLVIDKIADKYVVSFAYQKEIALVGPAYLLMKYEGKTN